MRTQLSAILDAVAELSAVDTSAVEPTSHAAGEVAPWRADEVRPSFPPEKALGNAPSTVGTSFAVPRIIE
jgi:aspartyl-tRNA(Asn)/glutamyl-tRNA(Gln) amidotransferase subunit C